MSKKVTIRTRNPNMPLRDLFYIASEYQVMVDDRSLYSSALQKLPTPKFIVFYNGREQQLQSVSEKGYWKNSCQRIVRR